MPVGVGPGWDHFTTAERHKILIEYLKVKVEERDWHGVSDAANDLREIEGAHPELKERR